MEEEVSDAEAEPSENSLQARFGVASLGTAPVR
jgi:hypothetical protein